MKQFYTTYVALFFLFSAGFSVAQVKVLRASLSSSVSDAHNIQVGNFKVQQSIGQMGINGVINHESHTVLRGFLLNQKSPSNGSFFDFDFTVSPNPFVDHINISFTAVLPGDVTFNIHDVRGRLVYEHTTEMKKEHRIKLDFLAQAEYILSVEVLGGDIRHSRNLLNYKAKNKQ